MGNDDDDAQLLHDYLASRSQGAFARLVGRYIDLVYSAARRQVHDDDDLAQDVTQATFILLSQKAASIRSPAAVGGWLLRTAHHVSCNALRTRRRRRTHENEAAAMTPLIVQPQQQSHEDANDQRQRVTAVLDAALARLRDGDRSAIVLRFLQSRS